MSNAFYETKNLFQNFTKYTEPLSYSEWNDLPQDYKAAVLYLQYFDQITLAWYKLKSVYSLEEDGVSEVLQYLNKNVAKIEEDERRFTPAYIYRVSYNCLYCLCRDPNRYKRVYENECSNIVQSGEDELDLFDTVSVNDNPIDRHQVELNRDRFWALIEDMGQDTVSVVAQLLGESDRGAKKLSDARKAEILDNLKYALADFKDYYNM